MDKSSAPKRRGFVYILTSLNTGLIKIGGTEYLPAKRIKEINATNPYRSLGPWTSYDFRQVEDWRKIERHLHYAFKDFQATDVEGQRELFKISPYEASLQLQGLDPAEQIGRPKVDRLFNDRDFAEYLQRLFVCAGLLNWLDIQGFWTLSLFPATSGGRYFTLSVGSHEVAFSPYADDNRQTHMIFVDKLLLDYSETVDWIARHDGGFCEENYVTADEHSVSVYFAGDFKEALDFLELPGVRRAIIAYWTERLVIAAERGSSSMFARFHNYNAVAELRRRIRI
ncbi:MAG: GIY-YIG nuclease family protein [Coriobacteriales bacterium]|jgi:hypothetical protein|nr:GIY-YIG nuclease family protein [Coriobacteriales bacterium]